MSKHSTLAGLSLSTLLAALGTSIANVALPVMARDFGAPFQTVQWIVLAYLLSVTALIVSAGRLGDLIGRRRLLLSGILLFTAASAVCGAAPTLAVLIVARAAQGSGAAIIMALTIALITETAPQAKIGSAMGMLGTMSAAGTALGPSIGGVLISHFGWRAIFLVNIPLGVVALLLAWRSLPLDAPASTNDRPRFDYRGTGLLALALAAYALAMTVGRGHFGWSNLMLLCAAGAGAGLFVFIERKAPFPLIRLALFRDPELRTSLTMAALVSTVIMATMVVGPFHLSRALGLDAAWVGIVMSAGPIIAALTGAPAGRMVDRLGVRRMTMAGLVAMATGCAALAALSRGFGVAGYLPPLVLITAGYAVFQAANNTGVMKNVSPDQRGVVSGLLNLARNLGLITGASVMGAVFAMAAATPDLATALPEPVRTGTQITFTVAAALMAAALFMLAAARSTADSPDLRRSQGRATQLRDAL